MKRVDSEVGKACWDYIIGTGWYRLDLWHGCSWCYFDLFKRLIILWEHFGKRTHTVHLTQEFWDTKAKHIHTCRAAVTCSESYPSRQRSAHCPCWNMLYAKTGVMRQPLIPVGPGKQKEDSDLFRSEVSLHISYNHCFHFSIPNTFSFPTSRPWEGSYLVFADLDHVSPSPISILFQVFCRSR